MYVIPDKKQPLDPYQVRAQLPRVGDRLLRTPELGLLRRGLRSSSVGTMYISKIILSL